MSLARNSRIVLLVIVGLVGLLVAIFAFWRYIELANIPAVPQKELALARFNAIKEVAGLPERSDSLINLRRNSGALTALQMKKGLRATAELIRHGFPAYYWELELIRPVREGNRNSGRSITLGAQESAQQPQGRRRPLLTARIAPDGTILSFTRTIPPEPPSSENLPGVPDSTVLAVAASFLQLSPEQFELSLEQTQQRSFGTINRYTLKTTSVPWADTLAAEMVFSRNRLRSFSVLLPEEQANAAEWREMVGDIAGIILVLALTIFFVVSLISRLRQDRIEFRNAFRVGLVATAAGVLSNLPLALGPEPLRGLLGAVFLAPLLGGIALVVAAVAESVARQHQPDKLRAFDLLVSGNVRHPRLGRSVLLGFAWAGITLGFWALILTILETTFPFSVQPDFAQAADLFLPVFGLLKLGKSVNSALFLSLVILLYLYGVVRSKRQNSRQAYWAAVLCGALLPVGGLRLFPEYWGGIYQLVYFAVVVSLFIREEWLTGTVFLFFMFFLPQTVPYLFAPGWLQINGWLAVTLTALLLMYGFLQLNRVPATEKAYVPEYVIRLQERERFQRELEIARRVQLQFLPQDTPELTWLDVAGHCEPAYEVGGDYYDFLPLDEDRFGMVIGDVSGKGISAAFYMTLLKGLLKSQVQHAQQPKEVLCHLNRLFYQNARRGVFISLIYGIFERTTQTFQFARAGHNPVVTLCTQTNRPEAIFPSGIAVGLDSGRVFERHLQAASVPFHEGDIFLFFTDGFPEARNERGEEFGEERLNRALLACRDQSAQEILAAIRNEVQLFCGKSVRHDDMTMVVVKIKNKEGETS